MNEYEKKAVSELRTWKRDMQRKQPLLGGGFGTNMILAKERKPEPNQSVQIASRTHIITLFTGSVGKLFKETNTGQFSLQLEPAFGITDIVSTSSGISSGPVIGLGFSPGASAVYMLALGKGRMGRQYFVPIVYRQYLSFHLGARAMLFNTSAAKGNIFEFGVSYRLATRPVTDYKLKE